MFSLSAINKKLHSRPVSLNLANDERGLTTVEYVIILVLIAVGAIGLWTAFGGKVNQRINDSSNALGAMSAEAPVK